MQGYGHKPTKAYALGYTVSIRLLYLWQEITFGGIRYAIPTYMGWYSQLLRPKQRNQLILKTL